MNRIISGKLGVPLMCIASIASVMSVREVVASELLEEIVVTARKRVETLQSVPMSITALTSAQLEKQGAMNFQDVAAGIPGLAFRTSGPGRQKLNIRGISSSGGTFSTVGYYIDEIAVSSVSSDAGTSFQQTNLDPDLFDVERVEILRGPQGTLYGSGSMGGTVKIVTKQPQLADLEGKANVQGSSTSGGGFNSVINAAVNLPIVPARLALRVAVSYRDFDGYVDRLVGDFEQGGVVSFPAIDPSDPNGSALSGVVLPGRSIPDSLLSARNVNTEDVRSARAALRWQLSPDFHVQPTFFWQKAEQGGKASFDTAPGAMDQRRAFDIREPYSDDFRIHGLNLSYDRSAFSIVSATGLAQRDIDNIEDATDVMTFFFGYANINDANFLPAQRRLASSGELVNLGDLFTGNLQPATVDPYPAVAVERNKARDFTQEVRLSSGPDSVLDWTVGAYYKRTRTDASHTFDVTGYSETFPLYAELGQLVFGSDGWPWGDMLADNRIENRLREAAFFGEVRHEFSDKLSLILGGRYYDYSFSFERNSAGLFYGGGTALSGEAIRGDARGDGFNPKVLLAYRFRDDAQIYLTAAKGFRLGAANAPVPESRCGQDLERIGRSSAPGEYGADSLWNYEVGMKSRFYGGRATINLAAFHIDWKDIQERVSLPECGFSFTDNVGDARSQGGEFEADFQPFDFLQLSAGIGYTDARIASGAPGSGLNAGDRLLDVPELTANAAGEVTFPVSGNFDGFARLSWSRIDRMLDSHSEPEKPSYDLANFRAGVNGELWEASVFVNNLSDERPIFTRIDTLTQLMPTYRRAVVGRPRTIGISVTRNF